MIILFKFLYINRKWKYRLEIPFHSISEESIDGGKARGMHFKDKIMGKLLEVRIVNVIV
jgi:hypothetical protein